MNSSSNWSTARTRRHSRASRRVARPSSRSGCSPGRISACVQSSLPGRTPPARAGSSPARSTDDLPLPDGPTTASNGAPTRRATSSATSRSRPKKYSASAASNVARPLYGQTAGRDGVLAVGADQAGALASRLQLDDAAGELLLERAGLAAAGRRAPGRRVDAACGLASRPLGGGLVNIACDPAARGQQRLDGHRLRAGRGVEGGDRPDAGGVERLEHERLVRLQSCECGGLLPGGQHEHRQATERRREIAQRRAHHGGRAVGIVDHDQRRPPRLARPGDRRQRRLRGTGPGRVEDRRVLAMRLAGDLRGQTRLAHPVRAGDRHQRARTGRSALPARPQRAQLAVAPDQRRRRRRVELARKLRRRRLDVQRRVLAQDRVVQAPQLGRRLDADLLDQRAPRLPVGLKRLGLAAAPIQRQHALPRAAARAAGSRPAARRSPR